MSMGVSAIVAGTIFLAAVAQGSVVSDSAGDNLQFRVVNNAKMRASALKILNNDLHDVAQDAKIRDCSILLWAQPGRVETIYVGLCKLKTGRTVAICGDTGVGEFGLAESFSPTKDGVAEFSRNMCPGG